MKKALISIISILAVVGIGVFAYFNFFNNAEGIPTDPPVTDSTPATSSSANQGGIIETKPPETFPDMQDAMDFYESVNKDTVGWLTVPNTDIADPTMQSVNNDYYLRQNENLEYDPYGCYFVDYESNIGDRDEMSDNTIIYGHSELTFNPDGLKFSQIFKFTDEEFAKETPIIRYASLEELMIFEVFAVFYTDINFNYIAVDSSPEEFSNILTTAMDLSIYDYSADVDTEDKILTLSTCDPDSADGTGRFVVMGKLLPADAEIPETATFTVK